MCWLCKPGLEDWAVKRLQALEKQKKMKDKKLATIIFSCYWHSRVVVFYFLFYFLFLPIFIRPQDFVVCMMGRRCWLSKLKARSVLRARLQEVGEGFEMLDP